MMRMIACAALCTLMGCVAVRDRRVSLSVWSDADAAEPFDQAIPGTALSLRMIPVASESGDSAEHLWWSRTEITWELYDAFVYGLDRKQDDANADAVARPSKPYVTMDRGFGHNGYPAISMSGKGAQAFCQWLSAKTNRPYRLPTVAEWKHICRTSEIDAEQVEDFAWISDNANGTTHPVGAKEADANGLHDLMGNAGEWCLDEDGQPVVMGGTYRDDQSAVGCDAVRTPDASWNASDPQLPRSEWWLADTPFVGFRVVCETANEPIAEEERAQP